MEGYILKSDNKAYITFTLGGLIFEYDEEKNRKNVDKHGISFRSAERVFFDYDRIELYDELNSEREDRYNTIGDLSAGSLELSSTHSDMVIGNVSLETGKEDILFVVYTERIRKTTDRKDVEVIRLISARYATSFERGVYYGKY